MEAEERAYADAAEQKPGKGGSGQGPPKGKVVCLHARAAKDPTHPSGAIFGTVEMDQIGFQVPYSFRVELDSGSQCMAVTRIILNMTFPNDILC